MTVTDSGWLQGSTTSGWSGADLWSNGHGECHLLVHAPTSQHGNLALIFFGARKSTIQLFGYPTFVYTQGQEGLNCYVDKKGWTRQCLLLIVDVSSLFGPFDWTRLMFFDTHMRRWYWVTLDHIGSMFSGIYGKLTSDWWPGNYTIWPGKFIMESLILWWYDGICPGKFPNLLANFLISWKLS